MEDVFWEGSKCISYGSKLPLLRGPKNAKIGWKMPSEGLFGHFWGVNLGFWVVIFGQKWVWKHLRGVKLGFWGQLQRTSPNPFSDIKWNCPFVISAWSFQLLPPLVKMTFSIYILIHTTTKHMFLTKNVIINWNCFTIHALVYMVKYYSNNL